MKLALAAATAAVAIALLFYASNRVEEATSPQGLAFEPTPPATAQAGQPPPRATCTAGIRDERWGEFVFSASQPTPVAQRPARRADGGSVLWEGSPFTHPDGHQYTDETAARADVLVPLLTQAPPGYEFLAATVLDHGGAYESQAAYSSSPTAGLSSTERISRAQASGDISITWSLRTGAPWYVYPDCAAKITIKGQRGILRQTSFVGQPRIVTLNWYVGDVVWSLQSTTLSPNQAIAAAESIRTVSP